MINKIVVALTMPLLLSASLLDFRALDEAKEGYTEGNYSKAIDAYERVEEKSDEVLYDEANSYYKLKEYEKAKELYSSIKKESLAFKKWHNLGNCHAQLGKLDEGIKAYEEALKIKEDEDTRFNLELLKKKKKEQEKKKRDDKKDKNKKDKDKKDKDKKDKDKKDDKNKDKKDSDKNKDDKEKKSDKQKKEDEKKKKEQDKKDKEKKEEQDKKKNDEKKDKDKNKDDKNQKDKAQMKKEPISDKELRKYQKMLDQRGINTLMVPLKTKGENSNELKPW
jgi:Ca-activated chloride channel family protein